LVVLSGKVAAQIYGTPWYCLNRMICVYCGAQWSSQGMSTIELINLICDRIRLIGLVCHTASICPLATNEVPLLLLIAVLIYMPILKLIVVP
jgi:hypothetical protein